MVNGHAVTQPLNLFLLPASGCKHHHMVGKSANHETQNNEKGIKIQIQEEETIGSNGEIAQIELLPCKQRGHIQNVDKWREMDIETPTQTAIQSPKGHKKSSV